MQTKLITAFVLTLLCQLSFAETCPTIKDIKSNNVTGWKTYETQDDTAASAARITEFKKYVNYFAVAEWTTSPHSAGTIHCYYRDKDGSDLGAYLSKNNLTPINNKNLWYQVTGSTDCAAGANKCEFIQKEQLANK